MRLRLAAIALLVAVALVVPTVAMSGGVDDVAGTVELSPHDGPNGKYASLQGGEVRLDFEQLNEDAKTTADNVLNITSNTTEPVEVWVETDVNESVTPYRGDDPDARIDRDNAVELSPNETVSIGFSIDTYGSTPDSGNVTVGVRDTDDSDGGSGGSGDGSGSTDDATTPTPTPVRTPGEPDVVRPATGVEVVFDGHVDGDAVRVQSLDSLPADGPSRSPRAVIARGSSVSGGADGLSVHGSRFVAQQDAPVHLTGSQSSVSPANGIARQPRPLAIVDITPPAELRESPALVRIRVDRDSFPQTAATDARIGRHTPDGWQLLPTRVVESDDETVLLEARTPGFSVFTVFAESTVKYEWELADGRTVQGDELHTSFAEAGHHNVSLRVTDAFDRSGTARQQVLVNDQPSVVIEAVPGGEDDDEVTLRANVSNEFGNTTTTWTLPNGSTATGPLVSGRFQPGDSVSVVVRDEFGGVGTTESVVAAAPAGSGGAVSFLPTSLPLWQYVLLATGAIVLAMGIIQSGLVVRLPDAGGVVAATGLSRLVDDSPEITRCSEPRWNPRERRVEIDDLEVSAPTGLLRSIEVAVTDSNGTPVVTRTIDVGARASYAASPEHVPIYGDVGLSPDERYRLEVRAVDENDLVGALEESHEWTVGTGTADL